MTLTEKILEHLAEFNEVMIDGLIPRHPKSRLARSLISGKVCSHKFNDVRISSVSSILSRLRHDGLITRSGSKKRALWAISLKGREKLKEQSIVIPPLDGHMRLVSFDISEKERQKRNWLRLQLRAYGFQPLHKSVWVGYRPLGEDLVKDLNRLGIIENIHIIEVGKQGTIRINKNIIRTI